MWLVKLAISLFNSCKTSCMLFVANSIVPLENLLLKNTPILRIITHLIYIYLTQIAHCCLHCGVTYTPGTYTFTYTVKPRFTNTRLIRTPRWYKHFVWPPQCPYKRLLTVSHYSLGVFLSPTLTKQNIPDQDGWFNPEYSWPHAIIERTMYVGKLKWPTSSG